MDRPPLPKGIQRELMHSAPVRSANPAEPAPSDMAVRIKIRIFRLFSANLLNVFMFEPHIQASLLWVIPKLGTNDMTDGRVANLTTKQPNDLPQAIHEPREVFGERVPSNQPLWSPAPSKSRRHKHDQPRFGKSEAPGYPHTLGRTSPKKKQECRAANLNVHKLVLSWFCGLIDVTIPCRASHDFPWPVLHIFNDKTTNFEFLKSLRISSDIHGPIKQNLSSVQLKSSVIQDTEGKVGLWISRAEHLFDKRKTFLAGGYHPFSVCGQRMKLKQKRHLQLLIHITWACLVTPRVNVSQPL